MMKFVPKPYTFRRRTDSIPTVTTADGWGLTQLGQVNGGDLGRKHLELITGSRRSGSARLRRGSQQNRWGCDIHIQFDFENVPKGKIL